VYAAPIGPQPATPWGSASAPQKIRVRMPGWAKKSSFFPARAALRTTGLGIAPDDHKNWLPEDPPEFRQHHVIGRGFPPITVAPLPGIRRTGPAPPPAGDISRHPGGLNLCRLMTCENSSRPASPSAGTRSVAGHKINGSDSTSGDLRMEIQHACSNDVPERQKNYQTPLFFRHHSRKYTDILIRLQVSSQPTVRNGAS